VFFLFFFQAQEYVAELKRATSGPYPLMKAWGMGGESCPAALVREMQEIFPNIIGPFNMYGPTEVTAVTVQHAFSKSFDTVVIGKPDPNTHVYVVDSSLHPVPIGVPGELLLSGPRLALGYAGRPDLTKEKFVPNPCFVIVSSLINPLLAPYYQNVYRTGDLVRWRSDGTIDFLGRIDRQIKISGVRIELGEVEAALEGAEGVSGAIAAAIADPTGTKRLVGYITPADVDTAAVTTHCRALLVAAMVPSVLISLESFPLLPNGKIDVRALPAPDWSGAGEEEYVAPADDAEAVVQRVFAEVLGRPAEELSVLADFFAAGGTSLQVFRAAALLQGAFEIASVPATLIHSERSARSVAAALTAFVADGGFNTPIPCNDWPDALRPLSANQEQMWLLSSLAGASAYNMPSALDFFAGAPDAQLLSAALDAVAGRHDVLRTVFTSQKDGSMAGIVLPASDFRVPVEVVEMTVSEEEVVREVAAETARSFDLESEPLVRVKLIMRGFPGGNGAVLALTMHHAVGDAWSQGVFWRELSVAYDALSAGKSPVWPPLPIQYADYAAWQREQLSGVSGDALRAFWKTTLAGAPAMVQLPQDRPRPSNPTFENGIARSSLPDGLLSKLESVARSLRVNMQAVLLAGLQAVLLRYTGQDDLVLGVPVAGRDRQETHGLVGYFINTLPVRCSASEEATFEDMVLSASKATLAALENSLLPLEEVVAAANIPRAPNVNPLFQILFQYFPEDTGNQPTRLGNNEYTPYARAGGLSMAKMDLILTISGGSLKADYMAELFDDLTITRIMRSFVGILEQLASSIKAPALAGSLLGNEEKEEVVAVSMGAQRPEYLSLPLVHDAISKVAIDSPDRQCLFFEGEWLSYGEVNARANTLAGQLSALGVESGVVVGLMLERSFELVVSILAVLKAGGCYLPCDPSYPDDRLAIYLDDAKTIVVLTQAKHFERASNMVGSGVEVIDVNKLSQENGGQSKYAAAPLKPPSPEDPAYIIFTSGSTGRPKGVMVPHRGLKDLMPWLVDMYHLNEKDAIMFSNTISFDAHVLQVFPPLTVGATLIIARPEGHFDPGYIVDLILDQTITGFMFTVPTLAREYVNEYKRRGLPPYLPMRSWGVGGESVPADVVRSMHEVFPNLEPINTYGPTEVTAVAVHYQFPRGFETVVIGRPDANLIAVIVDAALCPVPVGVPGELLLSGPRLGLGYAGRPDLTEEKFISNPCLNLFAGRVDPALLPYYQKVYRTGDLVRWRSDGNIDFMGRIDRQVKITGVRIELGEVEAALESTEGVAQAVAAAVADPSGQKRLVGYVTPGNVDMALVRSHCRSLLVPAMVPTVVTALDAFPLLPNGKVDVKSLPEPDWTAQASNPANMTARERTNVPAASVSDEHSVAVLNAIGDILGLEVSEIPVNAELFELGASSIQIAAIVGKIRKELGVSLDLRSVYADALIVKLCAAVRLEKGGDEHNQSAKSSAKHRILGYPIPIWSPSPRIQGIAQRALQSAFQLLAVTFLMLCLAASMLPGFSLIKYASAHLSTSSAIVIAPLAYFIWAASLMLISAAAKWILVRRYTSGAHPVWCFFFMRWWIVHRLVRITEKIALGYLSGTPFLFYYLQLMGATIDSNACINTCSVTDFDLIFIGKDSVVGESVLITGHSIERGFLVLQEVNIGSGCHVGAHSVVMPGASLDNGVSLEAMSMVPLGAALPPNTAWEGSPARPKEKNAAAGDAAAPAAGIEEGQQLSPSDVNKYKYVGIAVSIAMTWIALLPLAIAVVYLWQTSLVLVSFAAGFGFIAANVIYMAEAILLKWIVLGGRLKPGKYKANSTYAVRFSLVQSWLTMAPLAKSFCALFAHTSAMPIVLRALGAKLKGKNVIFGMSSTMLAGADQILLGEFATLGYGAAALGAVISRNELLIAPTIVEESCFIADGAVVMPGCCLGKGSLVGVQSIIQPYSNLAQGSVWSGSPAFCLDPGLSGAESVVSSSGKTVQKLKKQITRWQSSQKALLQRPNSKVLSSRGLVPVRTARTFEGNSMLLKTLSEDVDYTDDDENTSATNVRLAWKASLVGRGIKTSSGGSAKHGRSFHTSSAESSRSNTFLRRTSTAFSQASMIVEQLKEVKQTGSNYDRLSILVPSLVLPCWIFVALVVPLYCLNDAPGTSSGSIMSLLNYSTSFLMLFGATIAGLLVLTKIIIIGSFDVASYSMDGSSNSTALLHSTNLEVLCTAASTLGLDAIMGTQGAAWCLAALGARVGSDVFLENLPLVEADLLTLEDGVTIGRGTRIATYIVENGCMDFLNVHVAAEITFGPRSYSMPGVTFEKQSALGALSVAMKGETVSQGKYMEGSPLICVGTWYETASSGQGDGAGQPPVPAEHLAVVEQMQRDAQLPAEIKLPEDIVVRTGSPSVVLLTGATGYVGAFILRELLENASGIKKVYCLVRASSVEQGVERIKKQLLHHGLCTEKNWKSVFAHRVYALPGDLGQPRLGQTEGVFQDLCDEVDVVINNGALVNLSKGYDFMYAANVGAVLELLRLCIGGRALTPLHNISTVGTLPPRGDHVNLERFDAKGSALSMPGGYNQTKWVSEELISQANDRGLPVALYRLGRIGGDSKNGCGNESDFCMLILKGCLQMGCFPREHKFDLNIIPGDMTAKVLVNLALNSSGSFSSLGRVYHVTNPRPPPFQLALTVLRDMGYEFEEISYIAWRERLLSCSAETNALRPLEMAFGPFAPSKSIKRPMTDSSNAGIKENTTSAEMLKRDFTWFKKVGFFPAEAGKTS
jgi:non-ribosomal peptide synthetase-like protein